MVADKPTRFTVVGTLIAIYNDGSKFLFGWKDQEIVPQNSRSRDGVSLSTSYNYIPNQGDFIRSLTLSSSGMVHSKVLESGEMDGCVCKECKEFYPYAEPNQDDGTLICYSCRTIW